jgi:NADPH:quinone reductase-like Zn-dependent oxidoreductase
MKAVVWDRYGPPEVLRLEEVDKPVPADDEILVHIRAATVNRTDCHRRAADPFIWRLLLGLRRPKQRTLGMEFAGIVEQTGASVTDFAPGDEVFGMRGFGAHAEYLCVPAAKIVARKPPNVTFEEAAAVPDGAALGLGCLRKGGVSRGKHVLIYGASGSVGTACVQLAKHLGARVTAVCNTKNVELVRSLGADEVLDYTRGEDFTRNHASYDVVIDAVSKHSYLRSKRSLKPRGTYVAMEGYLNLLLVPFSRVTGKPLLLAFGRHSRADLLLVKRLLETGEYRAVIDRTYPLDQTIDAMRYVETQQKTGSVALSLEWR